jgi:hypothetical protein
VVSFTAFHGCDWALVDTEPVAAEALRHQPGVMTVMPARDGLYMDSSGGYYEVTHEGTQVARCKQKGGFVRAA